MEGSFYVLRPKPINRVKLSKADTRFSLAGTIDYDFKGYTLGDHEACATRQVATTRNLRHCYVIEPSNNFAPLNIT